jgi:hypothetical protein
MATTLTTPAALVPTLPDVANRRRKHLVTDLQGGDQLHLTAALLGFKRGAVVPLYGYCALRDAQGQVYSVRGYVRPLTLAYAVPFSEREAVRFRADNQQERWFGEVLMYLTEIDLTDYADCLRLERLSERVLPLLSAELPFYSQAA